MDTLKRQITHAKLVNAELDGVPHETKTYEGIGRMYVQILFTTVEPIIFKDPSCRRQPEGPEGC